MAAGRSAMNRRWHDAVPTPAVAPPTPEQLGYSEALVRQRAAELEGIAQSFEVTGSTSGG